MDGKRKQKKFIVTKIFCGVFAAIFAFSVLKIIQHFNDDRHTESVAEEAKSLTEISNFSNGDFSDTKYLNDEIIGWIRVPGTKVDYPFVQTTNNDFYLTHSLDKTPSDAGWVFLDYRNKLSDKNLILYAHGRLDGSLFGSLRDTLNDNWINDASLHYIETVTESGKMVWEIFSLYKIPTTSDYLKINFSENSFSDFVDKILGRSLHDFQVDVSRDDKIITLSTCYDDNEKLVLHGRLKN